ncbi:rhomboid family protein [Polaribacter porphyrae]|uniref:Rhomboid family intramembrane serine protease n=1 Tax=Polaribacter porphyrae TaxID=1137780 RepID=A0A2S7WLK7_9FLAO|nr:rhomboid family intramembrane serine protease [Polaribacter porphyrae]PQJ78191.1 rhomboid family intramembrane serine protease [Polaribacter porphyrae]
MSIIEDIKRRYITGNIVEKLILINVGVFILTLLITVFSGLYKGETNFISEWFALDVDTNSLLKKPWSIISYGFLHAGFLHILFNCIALYFLGNLFIQYFTQKQLLNFYLLGTFFGGVLYLFSQNYFPLFEGRSSYLLGASAGVSAIFVGIATHIPNYQVRFPLIGFIKLWHIAAFWVGIWFLGLIGLNAGGNFAHLGGALFGYLYISKASNKEITLFDGIANLFKKKEKPLKTVHKSKKRTATKAKKTDINQQEIDKILDKISKSGYDTLTKAEKEFLFKQGK